MKNLTLTELGNKMEYWRDVIGLNDWEIRASIERKDDMFLEDAQGAAQYQFISRQAYIQILDVCDYPDEMFTQDQEKTLVHELLHLKFALAEKTDEMDKWTHQLLNDMAKALIKVRRGK